MVAAPGRSGESSIEVTDDGEREIVHLRPDMYEVGVAIEDWRDRVTDADVQRADRAPDLGRFETLFLDHADAVLAYAARRSDPDTAQEVVADTFVVAWRRMAAVPDPALPWLLGVARRVLANQQRSARRAQALTLRLVREPRHRTDEPTDEVDGRLSAQAALQLLPPREREVLELLAWEGLSTAEAAEVLECSQRLLAVRVHRARRRLRAYSDEANPASVPPERASKERGKRERHPARAIEDAKEAR
ncbi:MAG: sigma-70 family RNA polymerase sigma factor [Actinobacteria bacterium]|nr:sigma-70 family RNA polymerase sigma factor [Actinomycetota bacterium]